MTTIIVSLCLLLGASISGYKLARAEQLPEPVPGSDFYPMSRDKLLNGRYKVHVKLGAGVYSTIWLVSDIKGGDG